VSLKSKIALWWARKRATRVFEGWLGRPLSRKERRVFISGIKNWRTTVAGLFAAIVQAYMGGMGMKAILAALPTLLIGILAKDGATGSQPGQ
jgi:hypothetical protein